MIKFRHKDKNQENFPVGMMIFSKDLRHLISNYYNFARYADDIADSPNLSVEKKLEKLQELESIFMQTKVYKGKKFKYVQDLYRAFQKKNIPFTFATDLLTAFRQDSSGFKYQTWGQLINYCKYSAAPVGKFMLAAHKESPTTYLPSTSLCTALQIVNHIQDLKYDFTLLNRLYLPTDIMHKYHIKKNDISQSQSSVALKKGIEHIMDLTRGLVKEGSLLPQLIKSISLRIEVCIILSLTNIMIKKILKGDVLSQEIKLSKTDWIRGIISGTFKGLTTRHKTLPQKGSI